MADIPPANKVLVIDDDGDILEFVVELLQDEISVTFANNGPKGLELAKFQKPDLILLDVMMPDMDGFEVCKRLQLIPETKNIPVIFLTGMGNEDDISTGLKLGAVDYITKPFNPDHVIAKVNNHLEKITSSRPSFVTRKKDRRATDQTVDDKYEPKKAAPQGTGKWRMVLVLVLTIGVGLGIKWLYEESSVPSTKSTEVSSPVIGKNKPLSETVAKTPAELLGYAWVLKSKCAQFPKVPWWDNTTHEKTVRYVDQRLDGDWKKYIDKWSRQFIKMLDISNRGSTAVTRSGKRLSGNELEDYVKKLEIRVTVIRCLAMEAAINASVKP